MEPFEAIVKHCEANSQFTKPLIDDFLIYYAAQADQLESKIAQKLKPYKHIARQLPTEYVNTLLINSRLPFSATLLPRPGFPT